MPVIRKCRAGDKALFGVVVGQTEHPEIEDSQNREVDHQDLIVPQGKYASIVTAGLFSFVKSIEPMGPGDLITCAGNGKAKIATDATPRSQVVGKAVASELHALKQSPLNLERFIPDPPESEEEPEEENPELAAKHLERRRELLAKKQALRDRVAQELFKNERQNFYKVSLFVNMM